MAKFTDNRTTNKTEISGPSGRESITKNLNQNLKPADDILNFNATGYQATATPPATDGKQQLETFVKLGEIAYSLMPIAGLAYLGIKIVRAIRD